MVVVEVVGGKGSTKMPMVNDNCSKKIICIKKYLIVIIITFYFYKNIFLKTLKSQNKKFLFF